MVTVSIHKFSSCDGCQLAFLNAGQELITLAGQVKIVNFVEAGLVDTDSKVDIAFIEGSISTPEEQQRIADIRNNSRYLITIGACATSGGLQSLRNMANSRQWFADIYATPEYISSLPVATPISEHVKVDLQLWGCPVNTRQVMTAIRSLLFDVLPREDHDKVCMECKRQGNPCVMVTSGVACMGPVTRTGCGAICPHHGRDCYACYGPAENINTDALGNRFEGLGLLAEQITGKFLLINNHAPEFKQAGLNWAEQGGKGKSSGG